MAIAAKSNCRLVDCVVVKQLLQPLLLPCLPSDDETEGTNDETVNERQPQQQQM